MITVSGALSHWEVKVGSTSMEEMWGTGFAGSSPPFLGRERAAVDTDVGPERERWVLLKIPRCDIDGVGEGK